MIIENLKEKDIVTKLSFLKPNDEDYNINIIYQNGYTSPVTFDKEKGEYVTFNAKTDNYLSDILNIYKEPFFSEVNLQGKKLYNIDMDKFIPTFSDEHKKFERTLKKVMHVMQKAYPTLNAEYVMKNLPDLTVHKLDDQNLFSGEYDTHFNSIFIDEDRLSYYDGFRILFHESIHMATRREESCQRVKKFACGFHSHDGWGRGLNEGMTEYLTENAVGTDGTYQLERRFAKMLLATTNKKEFIERYFEGDSSVLVDLFGNERKAKSFLTCVDVISGLDYNIYEEYDKLKEEKLNVAIDKYNLAENFDENNDDEIINQMEDEINEETKKEFEYNFYNISAISDAENLLLDVYEEELETLTKLNDNEGKKTLVKEFKKSFISYDEVDNKDYDDVVENGILSAKYLDMVELSKVSKRFKELNKKYVDYKILEDIENEMMEEENENNTMMCDDEYIDFIQE